MENDLGHILSVAGPYLASIGTVGFFVIKELFKGSEKREDSLLKNQFTKEDYLKYRQEDELRHQKEVESLNKLHEDQIKLVNQAHEDRVKNILSIHEVENKTNSTEIDRLKKLIDDLQKQITGLQASKQDNP